MDYSGAPTAVRHSDESVTLVFGVLLALGVGATAFVLLNAVNPPRETGTAAVTENLVLENLALSQGRESTAAHMTADMGGGSVSVRGSSTTGTHGASDTFAAIRSAVRDAGALKNVVVSGQPADRRLVQAAILDAANFAPLQEHTIRTEQRQVDTTRAGTYRHFGNSFSFPAPRPDAELATDIVKGDTGPVRVSVSGSRAK